jgi:hypothetical protein
MKIFEKYKNIRPRVEALLMQNPRLRDNDSALVANYLYHELGGTEGMNGKSAKDLLTMIANNELTSADAITRVRRKLQEECPELRGEKYAERKHEAEDYH